MNLWMSNIVEFLGFTLGGGFYLFLAAQFLRRKLSSPELAAFLSLCGAIPWFITGAIRILYYFAKAEDVPDGVELYLGGFESAGLLLLPAALLHLAGSMSTWFQVRARSAYFYLLIPLNLLVLTTSGGLSPAFELEVLGAMSILALGFPWDLHPVRKRFRLALSVSLGLMLAGALAVSGDEIGFQVLGALAPGICLGYFAVHYHIFELSINSRVVFAVLMSFVAAIYVAVAQAIAASLSADGDFFGQTVVLILVLGLGGILCIPIYGKLNRLFTRRSEIYAEFGKRLIQDAVAILDLRERLEFIAWQLGKTFRLKRVLLATADETEDRFAVFGMENAEVDRNLLREMASNVREAKTDAVLGIRNHRELLRKAGFPYLLPLWYEHRLIGLLFVDCTPKLSLGDDEAILWGLSRQITHVIESCRLIERKIDLEKELARSRQMALLGQMAATIAHEVKNPLSSIKTIGTLMQEDESLSEQNRRDLSFIVSETKRLNTCVEQLLSFARPKTEVRDDVSVSEMLAEIARVLTLDQPENGVSLAAVVTDELTIGNVERRKLREVVLNLALNAVQASEPGGVVELRGERSTDGRVRIAVIDTGKGIPPEIQERMFEPFFTTKQKGTGLGLAIVAQNVDHLGGVLQVQSPVRDGKGTTFTVVLPGGSTANEADINIAAYPEPAGQW